MEDATDFASASAKAAHVVLLCEMERGSVDWTQTHRIDCIRRAHAQKHTTNHRQNWGKIENNERPWYCKLYQNGTCSHSRDHESGGKVYKHICAHCLTQGRQAAHPERDCKSLNAKNEYKKRVKSCPVPGLSLGSCMRNDDKGHGVALGDVVHMSNVFNVVNKGEQGVNVPSVRPDVGTILCTKGNAEHNGGPMKHVTKCFYRSDLDKKEIRGLIAKGNKTKALGLSNIDKVVRSRTFVTSRTPHANHYDELGVKSDNTAGVKPIVINQDPLTTKASSQGGANNDTLEDSIVRDQKGVKLKSHSPIVGCNTGRATHAENWNDTSIVPVQSSVEDDKNTGNTFIDTMHLSNMESCGGMINIGCEDFVKVFDINATNDDKFTVGLF